MLKKIKKLISDWWNKSDIWYSRYGDGYADYPGVGIVYDKDVAEYAKKHLRLIDRLDMRKVAEAVIASQGILFGVDNPNEYTDKKNWKF